MTEAAPCPYSRCIIVETTYSLLFEAPDCASSRHGMTPRMLTFITIYRHATARMDSSNARGIFFVGSLTSSPRKQTL